MGFDVVYLPPIHPIGHAHRKGRNNTLVAEATDPAARTPSARAEGGIARWHRSSAGWRLRRLPDSGRGARDGARASTSPSRRARPPLVTEPRSGSATRPTARSSTPRTRRRSTRTSTRSTSTATTTMRAPPCGRSGSTSFATGSVTGCASSGSTTPTPSRSPSGPGSSARCSATTPTSIFLSEAFTRPKMMQVLAKVGFTPELHLLHLARERRRAARVPDRADAGRDARVLPRQPVHEHAGHQPAPHRSRPAGLRDPLRARRHPVEQLRHLLRLGAVRGRAARRPRGVPRQREVRDPRSRLGCAGQHQAPGRGAQSAAARASRPPALRQPALRERHRRPDALLSQGAAGPRGRRRPAARRALPLDRCGVRRGQLRPAQRPRPRSSTRICRRSGSAGTSRTE